jgi:hypothetical protein
MNISIVEIGKMVPRFLRGFGITGGSSGEEWKIKTFRFANQAGFHVRLHPGKKKIR